MNLFCIYDWTVWVPEPVKNLIQEDAKNIFNDSKKYSNDNIFFGITDLKDKYFKSSISIKGPCFLKNITVKGTIDAQGPFKLEGCYEKFNKTAEEIVVAGTVHITDVCVYTLVINGPLEIKNSTVNKGILVKGPRQKMLVASKELK